MNRPRVPSAHVNANDTITVEFEDGPRDVECGYDNNFPGVAYPLPIDGFEFTQMVDGEWFAYRVAREEYPEPDREWKDYEP